jgi:hypothetical protein
MLIRLACKHAAESRFEGSLAGVERMSLVASMCQEADLNVSEQRSSRRRLSAGTICFSARTMRFSA